MAKIQFNPGEYVILDLRGAMRRQGLLTKEYNLMLTNMRIIECSVGTFGSQKISGEWRISDVLLYDGLANVRVSTYALTETKLMIYLKTDQLEYSFLGRENKEVIGFANALNRIVTGTDEDIYLSSGKTSAIRAFAKMFTGVTTEESKRVDRSKLQKVAINCPFCGGSFEGIKGRTAKCPYCDSTFNT